MTCLFTAAVRHKVKEIKWKMKHLSDFYKFVTDSTTSLNHNDAIIANANRLIKNSGRRNKHEMQLAIKAIVM